jgi:hypothetical protein
MKNRTERERSQLYEEIVQLKMQAPDGKMRLTDVAGVEQFYGFSHELCGLTINRALL